MTDDPALKEPRVLGLDLSGTTMYLPWALSYVHMWLTVSP